MGLGRIFGKRGPERAARRRLEMDAMPDVVYAIGDVHGCLRQLLAVEAEIERRDPSGNERNLIVMMGDYIDRGPKSRDVIEHLIGPAPAGFQRVCLAGNHEQAMLDFLDGIGGGMPWLEFGGRETLASYGIDVSRLPRPGSKAFAYLVESHVPDEHLKFLRALPSMLHMPGWVFVHAGIRPGTALTDQDEEDLLWIRRAFLDAGDLGIDARVVHGHTPAPEPEVLAQRIGIDTGAFMTGRLTAVRLTRGGDISILQSD